MQVIKTATEIPQDAGSDVVNDFDDAVAEQIETEYRAEYLAEVEKRAASYEVKALNPSREGKKVICFAPIYQTLANVASFRQVAQQVFILKRILPHLWSTSVSHLRSLCSK